MPKLPRLSGRECIGVLKQMGFVVARQKGSHVILRCGERGCVVPMHREIRTGTLVGLLRQGKTDPQDFIDIYYGR